MSAPGNLLCVANFPANTGYAWDFIEGLYAGIADALAPAGVRTWVAYPQVDRPPVTLEGSTAVPLELDVGYRTPGQLLRLLRTIRRLDIRALYLSDRAAWHPGYVLLRLAGVRRIVVHDHTSGERTPPRGLKRLVKGSLRRFRPALADVVLAVSDYVGRRKVEVDLVDPARVRVVWNSVEIPEQVDRNALRDLLDIPRDRPVVLSVSRAAEYKGIQHLLRAFDRVWKGGARPRPVLIYLGDGPYMDELRALRDALPSRDDILMPGYRPGAARLIGGADLCVVPSTWAEAFGLAALEPAARGVPVVATRVGGIPEVVVDGETGVLVEPADVEALADAIEDLLADDEARRTMGEAGRARAAATFSRAQQIRELATLFRAQLGLEAA